MTRLPAGHRLAPADARDLLSGSFEGRATVRKVYATNDEAERGTYCAVEFIDEPDATYMRRVMQPAEVTV